MPQDGRILPITIEAGQAVSKGQVLAQMDAADFQSALELAEAEIKEIEAQIAVNAYDKIENTALVESKKLIAALDATGKASNALVRTNEAEQKYARWLVEMEEKLVKQRASSKEKLQRAQRDYGQAESQVASARFMSRATWAIAAVVDLFPRYVQELLGRKHLEGAVLRQRLAGARAARDLATRSLQRATMKSPVDGMVLRRLVKNEAYLAAGTLLLEIGVMGDLAVTADILSQDVVTVRPRQPGGHLRAFHWCHPHSRRRKARQTGRVHQSLFSGGGSAAGARDHFIRSRNAQTMGKKGSHPGSGIPGSRAHLHGRKKQCSESSPNRPLSWK